jgi:hypothetical protein
MTIQACGAIIRIACLAFVFIIHFGLIVLMAAEAGKYGVI